MSSEHLHLYEHKIQSRKDEACEDSGRDKTANLDRKIVQGLWMILSGFGAHGL